MLDQRRRQWANIETTLVQRRVFTGYFQCGDRLKTCQSDVHKRTIGIILTYKFGPRAEGVNIGPIPSACGLGYMAVDLTL